MSDLLVLRSIDIVRAKPSYDFIEKTVKNTLIDFSNGYASNPSKIVANPDPTSMAIAMLGHVPRSQCFGIKSYAERACSSGISAGSTLTLLDDQTGLPIAVMDCDWITSTRTGAVCLIMVRELAIKPKKVLIVGAGRQTQGIVAALLSAETEIEEVSVLTASDAAYNTVADSAGTVASVHRLTRCTNVLKAAALADVVIGAAGPQTKTSISLNMLKPGALAIYVGHGLSADVLHGADQVISTSDSQMKVTGADLADADGNLPSSDAELGAVLSGAKPGRTTPSDIIAAYNSGLAITDVAIGRYLFDETTRRGGGCKVVGFTPVPNSPQISLRSGAA